LVSPEISQHIGCNTGKLDLQKCSLVGSPVERWELIFRLKLKSIFVESLYLFPNGIKMFHSYHPNINANPDNPSSRCYARDVTARYDLAQWLKTKQVPIVGY
jgi:hypothetical protein